MASQLYTAFWQGYSPSGPGGGPVLSATPGYIDRLVLAFGNLYPGNSTCLQFLQKSHSQDEIREGIAAIREQSPDTKILLSLIGTPAPAVGWNDGITDPAAFGDWCAGLLRGWDLDGIDIDNEDLDSFPGDQFVATVKGMRAAMPDAILTLDTYHFNSDSAVIRELAEDLTGINTMAYFLQLDEMKALVEQYATVIAPEKISIGVKAAPVGVEQGTSLADTAALSAWNPSAGAKCGMMLWNLTIDVDTLTGEPDGSWTRAIHENLP